VPSQSNTTLVSYFDCPGGGKVWVEGTTLFIAHMHWPAGATIVDVADPRHPRALATIDMPDGWHSHKARAANGIMIVNHEQLGQSGSAEFGGGSRTMMSLVRAPHDSSPNGARPAAACTATTLTAATPISRPLPRAMSATS
jgi:hypothetical protein